MRVVSFTPGLPMVVSLAGLPVVSLEGIAEMSGGYNKNKKQKSKQVRYKVNAWVRADVQIVIDSHLFFSK
jgi:hypothetical protein